MEIGAKIRRLLQDSGMSANAASLKAGLPRDAVRDIITGRSKHPRADTLAKVAAALGVPPSVLLEGGPAPSNDEPAAEIELPILFKVAAGTWLAQDELWDEPIGSDRVPIAPEYARWPQWLELVQGDSVDKLLPDGALVHVVDAIEMGYTPKDADLVVVTRTRAQGAFIERSLKQVVITPFGIELWPRSHNPRWDQPLNYTAGAEDHDDTVVQIVGKVIRGIMRF
jgi:Predicted transcriptional regulators